MPNYTIHPSAEDMARDAVDQGHADIKHDFQAGVEAERARIVKHLRSRAAIVRRITIEETGTLETPVHAGSIPECIDAIAVDLADACDGP